MPNWPPLTQFAYPTTVHAAYESGWRDGSVSQTGIFCHIVQLRDELARAGWMPALQIIGCNGCIRQPGRVVREGRGADEKAHCYRTGFRSSVGSSCVPKIFRRPAKGGIVSCNAVATRFAEPRPSGTTQSANRLPATTSHAANSRGTAKSLEAEGDRTRLEAHCYPSHGDVARQRRKHSRSSLETKRQ